MRAKFLNESWKDLKRLAEEGIYGFRNYQGKYDTVNDQITDVEDTIEELVPKIVGQKFLIRKKNQTPIETEFIGAKYIPATSQGNNKIVGIFKNLETNKLIKMSIRYSGTNIIPVDDDNSDVLFKSKSRVAMLDDQILIYRKEIEELQEKISKLEKLKRLWN